MRNRRKSASLETREYIQEQASGVEQSLLDDPMPNNEHEQPPVDDTDEVADDSWLDELTPYETKTEQSASDTQETAYDEADEGEGTQEQRQRLAELYDDLEHIDGDVAREVHDKILNPELQALRAEVAELRRYREQEQQARQSAVLSDINSKILQKYPKASTILQSREFMDYVNKDSNPYARESEFDVLMRAYYSGDAKYVLTKIDNFVSSRGKPKPQVGVEPHRGGGSGRVSQSRAKRPMSEAEYLEKRKRIKAAPKGTYPPNALRDLVNEYLNRG